MVTGYGLDKLVKAERTFFAMYIMMYRQHSRIKTVKGYWFYSQREKNAESDYALTILDEIIRKKLNDRRAIYYINM